MESVKSILSVYKNHCSAEIQTCLILSKSLPSQKFSVSAYCSALKAKLTLSVFLKAKHMRFSLV